MSIKIVPKEQLTAAKSSVVGNIPLLLFARLDTLYQRRAERFSKLAEGHPFADYLYFAASIARAQQKALHDHPLHIDLSERLSLQQPPLRFSDFPLSKHWHNLLSTIITELAVEATPPVAAVLENLSKNSQQTLDTLAKSLLCGDINAVGNDKALFIWAALSLYWAQLASQIPGQAHAEYGEQRHFCPICQSAPVASIVHIGANQGLRYLHCSLCETEWHMVRIKCSNCEESSHVDYWSLDSENSPTKAESCDNCGSYLKVFYQEKDPYLEVVADDLATLALDSRMEEKGFARSSINPFLFISE